MLKNVNMVKIRTSSNLTERILSLSFNDTFHKTLSKKSGFSFLGGMLDKIKDRMTWNTRACWVFLSISTVSHITSKVAAGHVVQCLNYISPIIVQACTIFCIHQLISSLHQNYDEEQWLAISMRRTEH